MILLSTLVGTAQANHDGLDFSHRNGHVFVSDNQCLWLDIMISKSPPGYFHDKPKIQTYGSIDYRVITWDAWTGEHLWRCRNTSYQAPPSGLAIRQSLAHYAHWNDTVYWCNVGPVIRNFNNWAHDLYTWWGPSYPCGGGWFYLYSEIWSNAGGSTEQRGMNTNWLHT